MRHSRKALGIMALTVYGGPPTTFTRKREIVKSALAPIFDAVASARETPEIESDTPLLRKYPDSQLFASPKSFERKTDQHIPNHILSSNPVSVTATVSNPPGLAVEASKPVQYCDWKGDSGGCFQPATVVLGFGSYCQSHSANPLNPRPTPGLNPVAIPPIVEKPTVDPFADETMPEETVVETGSPTSEPVSPKPLPPDAKCRCHDCSETSVLAPVDAAHGGGFICPAHCSRSLWRGKLEVWDRYQAGRTKHITRPFSW